MKKWTFNQALPLLLAFSAGLCLPAPVFCGSDWIEEDHPSFRTELPPKTEAPLLAPVPVPVPAPDFRQPGRGQSDGSSPPSKNKVLQGQASTFDAGAPRVVPPRFAAAAAASLGADAESFLLSAESNASVPPSKLRAWLDRTHPEFRLLAQDNPEAVVEVRGQWDDAAKVLSALGVRFRHIKAKELVGISLVGTRVVVLNCEGRVPREAVESLRQWVIRGGYLISTDWTLGSFVERAFPGYIAWNGQSTEGIVVDALVTEPDPELFAGAPLKRSTWKLDQMSQMVKVLKPSAVRVLARSYKLGSTDRNRQYTPDPNQWGVLAVEFPYGRGHVLHLVGHFDYNSPLARPWTMPDPAPGLGLSLRQVIATNFLIKGLEARPLPDLHD